MTIGPSLKSRNNPIRGELRNWYPVGSFYGGDVFGDNRGEIKNGTHITTSFVKQVVDRGDYFIIKTISVQWMCYKNTKK